jgi:rSAM/selenodomain-associated transferase 1
VTAPEASVLYIVAKAPQEGTSKTRLSPPLTPAAAADLARAFLLDTVAAVQAAGIAARIICRDEPERAALQEIVAAAAAVHVQDGSGLGDALTSAFVQGLEDGFPATGVLAMDTPTVSPRVLRAAFTCLEQANDVALGPAEDGGYYLLAARSVHPGLFQDMIWSTSTVARETLDRCLATGLRPHLLPFWRDVDRAADLEWLDGELRRAPAGVAPHTRLAWAEISADRGTDAVGDGSLAAG